MPEAVRQHLVWITQYCAVASDANWRDMLSRIEHQIGLAKRDANNSK